MVIEMVYNLGTIYHTLTTINAHCIFDTFSNKHEKVITVSNTSGPSSLRRIHCLASACHPNTLTPRCADARHPHEPQPALLSRCCGHHGKRNFRIFDSPLATTPPPPPPPPPPPSQPPPSPISGPHTARQSLMRASAAPNARHRIRQLVLFILAIVVWSSAVAQCHIEPATNATLSTTMATSNQLPNSTNGISVRSKPFNISSIDSDSRNAPIVGATMVADRSQRTNQTVDSEAFDISIAKHVQLIKSTASVSGVVGGERTARAVIKLLVPRHSSGQRIWVKRIRKFEQSADAEHRPIHSVPVRIARQFQLQFKFRRLRSANATSPLKRLFYGLTAVQPVEREQRLNAVQVAWNDMVAALMRNGTVLLPLRHNHSEMLANDTIGGNGSDASVLGAIAHNKFILWNFTQTLARFVRQLEPHEMPTNNSGGPTSSRLLSQLFGEQPRQFRIGYTPAPPTADGNASDALVRTTLKHNVKFSADPMGPTVVLFTRISVCLNCTHSLRPPAEIVMLPKRADNRQLHEPYQPPQPANVALWPRLSVRLANMSLSTAAERGHGSSAGPAAGRAANRSTHSAYAHTSALFNILRRSAASIPIAAQESPSPARTILSSASPPSPPSTKRAQRKIPINYSNIDSDNNNNNNFHYATKFDNNFFPSINYLGYDTKIMSNVQATKFTHDNNSIDNEITKYDESNIIDDNTNGTINDNNTINVTGQRMAPTANASTNITSDIRPLAGAQTQPAARTQPHAVAQSTQRPGRMPWPDTAKPRLPAPTSTAPDAMDRQPKKTISRTTKSKRLAAADAAANEPKSLNSHLMRLESIKYQILMKLGLKQRPNITRTLSRHVVMSAITRADGNDAHPSQNINAKLDEQPYPYQHSSMNNDSNDDDINVDNNVRSNDIVYTDTDDLHGQTREIILFAERGTNFNHQPLIEFALGSGLNSKANIKLPATAEQNQMLASGKGAQAKQRSKCKDGQSKQRKLSKRKRRRRRGLHEDTVPRPATDEPPPMAWTADKRHAFKETLHHDVHANDGRAINEAKDPEQGAHVRHAMLWIKVNVNENMSKKHMKWAKRQKPKLWLFQITGQPASVSGAKQNKVIASKNLNLSRLGWQKLDITSTVRQWYEHGSKTRLRFLVDCSGCTDRIRIHLFDDSQKRNGSTPARNRPNLRNGKLSSSNLSRPFLVIYTDPHVIRRVRRHTPDCSTAANGQCCKQKFFVSFAELGWDDWIIAPHGYYANYCQGNCNGFRTPDNLQSYHSHVIEEYRKMNRLTGMQPCCTPLRFSSMSLIYYEDDTKIIKRDLPKMIVDECGCP